MTAECAYPPAFLIYVSGFLTGAVLMFAACALLPGVRWTRGKR